MKAEFENGRVTWHRQMLSHTLVLMGVIQLLPLAYILWANISPASDTDPPMSIKVELLIGLLAASIAPILVAIRLRHGYGFLGAKVLLLVLFPFALGEVSLPVFLVFKSQSLPWPLVLLVAVFLLHAFGYAAATYFYATAHRTG